jgi:hypothetical protein
VVQPASVVGQAAAGDGDPARGGGVLGRVGLDPPADVRPGGDGDPGAPDVVEAGRSVGLNDAPEAARDVGVARGSVVETDRPGRARTAAAGRWYGHDGSHRNHQAIAPPTSKTMETMATAPVDRLG